MTKRKILYKLNMREGQCKLMRYRKTVGLLLGILILIHSLSITAQGVNATGNIYATDIVTAPGSLFEVPICLKDNPGMMGLGIEVFYDENVIAPVSIKKGAVLQQGMLTDSIGASDYEGKIKVLWSHTDNVSESGELFYIQFETIAQEETLTELKITCIAEDTFDSDWKEIKFTTDNSLIRIKADVEVKDEENTQVEGDSEEAVQEEESKNDTLQERIDQAIDIRDEVKKQLTNEEIKEEIKKALEETGAEHPKDVKKDQQSKFIQRVSSLLQQKDVDIQSLWENNTNEQKMEVLTYLWDDVAGIKTIEDIKVKKETKNESQSIAKAVVWAAVPVFFLIIIGLCWVYRKKRREKHDGKNG